MRVYSLKMKSKNIIVNFHNWNNLYIFLELQLWIIKSYYKNTFINKTI